MKFIIKVLSTLSDSLVESDIKPLIDYLYNGGGILIATTGWGWKLFHNNLSLSDDNLGNKISSALALSQTIIICCLHLKMDFLLN